MLYESTRGSKFKKTSAEAIIAGIAEDNGLYVPAEFPKIPWESLLGKSYKDVARTVIDLYFNDFTQEEIDYCVDGAYDEKFSASDICEIKEAGGAYFLELYHGKTAAFKDMALSILPYLLTTSVKKVGEKSKICILTATSGDTGKAALEGFANVKGTEIIVFYPDGGVSEIQRQQMITQIGTNTHVFAIRGNFDDAQTGVKNIFSDEDFAAKLAEKNVKLSSANSINIGRLVPQVAYYVYSYVKLCERGIVKPGRPVNVVVPTGNFGNILAAYFAKEGGVPIGKLICASNDNKVLTDFIASGEYDIRPDTRNFTLTNSPSMDILISSNLERLLYLASERDGEKTAQWMAALKADKKYSVNDVEGLKECLAEFYGGFSTEAETLDAIGRMWKENSYLMDTHTGVAYKVFEDYKKETGDETPCIIASTASAYKFAEAVGSALGLEKAENGFRAIDKLAKETNVTVPEGLKNLDKKIVFHDGVVDIEEMPEAVLGALK